MKALLEHNALDPMLRFQSDVQQIKSIKDKTRALEVASREFESVFLTYLLKGMRQATSIGEDGGLMGGNGLGAGVFQDLFEVEIARKASQRQSLGLASMVYKQLSRLLPPESGSDGDKVNALPDPLPVKRARVEESNRNDVEPQPKPPVLPEAVDRRLKRFEPIISEASETYQVDPDLIRAVIVQESSARPDSVSSRGAKGLMQLMDSTASDLGVKDSFDVEENIKGGTRYLKWLLDRFRGEEKLALASYNAGPGRVESYGGVPPFPETEQYVNRVLSLRNELKVEKVD